MTIASAIDDVIIAQGGTPDPTDTIADSLVNLAGVLAGENYPKDKTIEDAVTLLGEHIGGGGAQTTDVYLWNWDSSLGAHGITAAKYKTGADSFEDLQFEGITTEYNEATIYGVKVKDVPVGASLLLATVNGDFEPSVGYSNVTFPPQGASGPYAPMPIDGLYAAGSYNTNE